MGVQLSGEQSLSCEQDVMELLRARYVGIVHAVCNYKCGGGAVEVISVMMAKGYTVPSPI